MKLGCCINMLGDETDPLGSRYLPLLKPAGYDYAEVPLAQIMDLTESEFDLFLHKLKASGIPCLCCNNFFPAHIRLTGDDVDSGVVEAYVKKAMERASVLGAEKIVFGSSGAKNVPEGFPLDRAFCQLVETLRLIDGYGKTYGILIVIEPLNHMESNIILNLSDGKRLMDVGKYENVFLLVDYYHFMKEKDSLQVLGDLMSDIRHVHFAEPEGRKFPAAMEDEYRRFFEQLRVGGYDGLVSVEAYSKEPEEDLKKAVFLKEGF